MKNAQKTSLKYFLYARKSTESEDRQVASIDSQIDEMKKIALRQGIQIIEILSESGSAKTLGRIVFNKMLDRIIKGEANGLLCWKLDRLARNFDDGGKIIGLLQRGVIQEIRTYEKTYLPSDNVLMIALELGMANQYSRDLSVNVSRGLKAKAQMGWYPVQPPIGYLNSKTKGKGCNDIFKDTERFDLVRKIMDLMLTGTKPPSKILRIATDEWGLRTRRGAGISRSGIYHLLTNPFYYGMFEFPKKSGNWYQGLHEPMITIEEYDKIQILLGRKGSPRPKANIFDFTGMMRCGECGCMITAEAKVKRQLNGNVHHYVYYHCTKRKNPNCAQGSIETTVLKKQIVQAIESVNIPPEFHSYAMKWFRKRNEEDTTVNTTILTSQQKAYNVCVKKIAGLIDMRAGGEISEQEFGEKKTLLLKDKSRLEELLADSGDRVSKQVQNADDLFTFARDAVTKFNKGPIDTRKRILSTLGSNLVLKDRILRIDWEKSLLPTEKLAHEVRKLHEGLEPPKTLMAQGDFDRMYSESPIVSAL